METEKATSESKKKKIQGGVKKAKKSRESANNSTTTTTAKKSGGGGESKRRSKEPIDDSKVIRLLGNRSVYHVAVEDFVRVSQLIKQQQTAGNLMATVDLHRFSDHSIMAFVNFVQNREIKSSLTYYSITELVTLAHTFQMKDLKACLEDSIIEAAKLSEADLLQTMIICDVAHLNPETEKTLQTLATEQIDKLVGLPDFHKVPFYQLYQILSSCELAVLHEMFVADVVLLWLIGQDHVNAFAPSLLSCIRTKFLSPVDRTLIIERINQLKLPSKLVRLARNVLESTSNQRICLDSVHLKKNWPRCGANVNTTHFNPHSSLPLSRPTFNMKMKKKKEAKVRPTFDPATAPKVIDLINTDPKVVKSERSVKKKEEKKDMKNKKKQGNNNKSGTTTKKTKRSCACVEYVKSKMSRKAKKKGPPMFQDPNSIKVRPPGESSKQTESSTKASKSSVTSKLSSSTMNSSRSESHTEKRRAQKRGKIQKAIKSSKSETENSEFEFPLFVFGIRGETRLLMKAMPPLEADVSNNPPNDVFHDQKWLKIFPASVAAMDKSSMFMSRVIFVVFSMILDRRKILPPEYFASNYITEKLKMKSLNFNHAKALAISHQLRDAGDATKLGYLEELALVVTKQEDDVEAIEVFSLKFHYFGDGGVAAQLTTEENGTRLTPFENLKKLDYNGTLTVRDQLIFLARSIHVICSKVLHPLPGEFFANLRASYTPEAPSDFRIKGFRDSFTFYTIPEDTQSATLGHFRPGYHGGLVECTSKFMEDSYAAETILKKYADKAAEETGIRMNTTLYGSFANESESRSNGSEESFYDSVVEKLKEVDLEKDKTPKKKSSPRPAPYDKESKRRARK
ncbi:unnamed protein product [Caenorhabditis sp. 36 PRJEB53466]|nr:unnamed protein product [Caenorhabditis sp. 36 PRJEB53466]